MTAGKTMGIPILYPWANRLGENTYTAEGVTATLTAGENGVRADPNGLPIHGVLAGYPGWRVTAESANELTAELDFAADPQLLASFPYPHVLTVAVRLAERTLTVRTTVSATAETAVPLCFGFHPYLRLPDVARAEWVIHTPPLRHLLLDERGLPSGASEPAPAREEALGDKAFDDAYDQVPDGAVFAVSGGGRRLEVHFQQGYPATQIFAPKGRPRKSHRVLRADDRTDRRPAPRRLPMRAAGRTGGRAVRHPGLAPASAASRFPSPDRIVRTSEDARIQSYSTCAEIGAADAVPLAPSLAGGAG